MPASMRIGLFILALVLAHVAADVYMEGSVKGSNCRLDEENRDRNNANRCADTQNNNRGGVNVGTLVYHQGSTVHITWKAQHSCGAENNKCEIILQYMCDDRLRDGTTTQTIPDNPAQCTNLDCDTDLRYLRHESYDYYQTCKRTERNRGLFISNRNLQGDDARYTRQNNDGTRYAYECPEERDYYPYWRPSPWRDIAVLTNDPQRCAAYRAESQNVKSRFHCVLPVEYLKTRVRNTAFIPITKEQCEKLTFNGTNATWTEVPAWGIPPPECRQNVFSRDNHLGNAVGGFPASFNWTAPTDFAHDRCAIRIRYNITSTDFPGFQNPRDLTPGSNYTSNQNPAASIARNQRQNTNPNTQPARADVWTKFGITAAEVADSFNPQRNGNAATLKNSREYVLKNNPRVDIFGDIIPAAQKGNLKLQLAINTAQLPRTFEDRSHRVSITPRPEGVEAGAAIHNLNVQGKRGNIVQVFPSVEYDFVPNRLHVKNGDYVHFQWSGSNTNPNDNAGQGRQGSDRSNVIPLRNSVYSEGQGATTPPTVGALGANYPGSIKAGQHSFLGFAARDLAKLAILEDGQRGGELSELDDAGTYFDLGPKKVTSNGVFNYMCTRNNNFSNRSQKGTIIVSDGRLSTATVDWNGATVPGDKARIVVPQAALSTLVEFGVFPRPTTDKSEVKDAKSDYVTITPADFSGSIMPGSKGVTVEMDYEQNSLYTYSLKRTDDSGNGWQSVDASFNSGTASFQTKQGGTYVVVGELNSGAVAGIVIGCVVFVVLVAGGIVWYRKRKNAAAGAESGTARNVSTPAEYPLSTV